MFHINGYEINIKILSSNEELVKILWVPISILLFFFQIVCCLKLIFHSFYIIGFFSYLYHPVLWKTIKIRLYEKNQEKLLMVYGLGSFLMNINFWMVIFNQKQMTLIYIQPKHINYSSCLFVRLYNLKNYIYHLIPFL